MAHESQELDNDSFFEMEEDDEIYETEPNQRGRWLTVAIVLLSVIIAIVLCVVGIRQLSEAHQNAGYEDKSWVISGKYVDLTPDLQTKDNVAIYSGAAPADDQMNGVTYISNLSDSKEIQAGQTIEFRGTQTGMVAGDFEKKVDALVAKTDDNQVEVVRTGSEGSLKPVTSGLVSTQKTMGWLALVGAVLVFAAGVWGAIRLNRRSESVLDFE
ncbi:hypothetical protein [uncultured Rothia sp.]|uniref:hypothetical protein n=1 Tax=uncultured Rothia sp. TaxID=316088 RepID=UPI00321760C3